MSVSISIAWKVTIGDDLILEDRVQIQDAVIGPIESLGGSEVLEGGNPVLAEPEGEHVVPPGTGGIFPGLALFVPA
jgi:hypothetical protein